MAACRQTTGPNERPLVALHSLLTAGVGHGGKTGSGSRSPFGSSLAV